MAYHVKVPWSCGRGNVIEFSGFGDGDVADTGLFARWLPGCPLFCRNPSVNGELGGGSREIATARRLYQGKGL